jgi:hypothetical protein
MALLLNSYQRYIDLESAEGLKLYNGALYGFESPLADGQKINLVNQDFQKLNDQMNCLGSQFRYEYVFKRVPKTRMVIPEIPAVVAIAADPTATPPVLAVSAVAAVPEQIIFGLHSNMLETYSAENLNVALLNASITWGNDSFTNEMPQIIRKMTIANGLAMTPSNLKPSKPEDENLQMACLHSKFLAHQLLESLSSAACQSIQQFKKIYTWTSPDRKDEEMDRLTILALVINCICPLYKVDMYLKIKKIKKQNLEQYENNLELFFDSICYHKLHIDQKNPMAYTDNQFVCDISSNYEANNLCLHFIWNLSVQK